MDVKRNGGPGRPCSARASTVASGAVIGPFIRWLQEERQLSQSEIARRARVSQGWLSRTALGSGARVPRPDLLRQLFDTFAEEWRTYRQEHPSINRELARLFGWAYPLQAAPDADDPALARAIEDLRVIARGGYRDQIFAELQLYAGYTREAGARRRRAAPAAAPRPSRPGRGPRPRPTVPAAQPPRGRRRRAR